MPRSVSSKAAFRSASILGHVGAEVPGDGADLVLRQPGHAHPLGDPLDLARARARGARLGRGRRQGPAGPLAPRDDVLGEEAARAQLGHPERELAHAGLERARPAAVPAVAGGLAHLVGPGVHDAVGDVLGESADELLQVDGPVLEPGHRARLHRDSCYILHAASVPFLEPDLSRFQIPGRRPPRVQSQSEQALTPTFPTRSAGNRENIAGLPSGRVELVAGDICDAGLLDGLVPGCDAVVHCAAETHNDSSIADPEPFLRTNVFCQVELTPIC